MNVWLVTIGEPIPVREGARDRLYRTGYFGQFLAHHGHDVTWWASTFDHSRKKHWFDETSHVRLDSGLDMRLLHGCGYSWNMSPYRLRDHHQIARQFSQLARQEKRPPDIVLCSFPTIDLCLASVEYGEQTRVPVVLDMRDMWPDIFAEMMIRPLRPLVRLACWPMYRAARRACSRATAITGITESFVDWGLSLGNRSRSSLDCAFPMGYATTAPSQEKIQAAEKFWDQQGILADSQKFTAAFVGTIGRQLDVRTIIQAARKLASKSAVIQFVLCGVGDCLPQLRRLAAGLPNVIFPGWIDAAAIHVLMRRSRIGLDPLPDRFDFHATINNKAIEYMSAGLPILSSPNRGVLAELLNSENCGLSYAYGDVDGLVTTLLRLVDDPEQTKILAWNSARLFQNRFTAEGVYREMMTYLKMIVDARAHPSTIARKAA